MCYIGFSTMFVDTFVSGNSPVICSRYIHTYVKDGLETCIASIIYLYSCAKATTLLSQHRCYTQNIYNQTQEHSHANIYTVQHKTNIVVKKIHLIDVYLLNLPPQLTLVTRHVLHTRYIQYNTGTTSTSKDIDS